MRLFSHSHRVFVELTSYEVTSVKVTSAEAVDFNLLDFVLDLAVLEVFLRLVVDFELQLFVVHFLDSLEQFVVIVGFIYHRLSCHFDPFRQPVAVLIPINLDLTYITYHIYKLHHFLIVSKKV